MYNQIRALVDAGQLTFKGAKNRDRLGDGDYAVLIQESAKFAKATGQQVYGCFRQAVTAYWRLYDERK